MTQPASKRLVTEAVADATYATQAALATKVSATAPTLAAAQSIDTADALALRRFRAAVANRATKRVNMAHIGDSVTHGFMGADPLPKMAERWPAVLAATFRSRFPVTGVTGGLGFIPSRLNTASGTLVADSPLSWTGSLGYDTSLGLVLGSAWMPAADRVGTLNFTGTGVDILHSDRSGGGTFAYAIDGGAAVNVNTSATSSSLGVTQVRGLTAGAHTLTLTYVTNYAAVAGFYIYNGDEAAGFSTWNLGWTGIASDLWALDTQSKEWPNAFAVEVKPDLLTIELGLNDQIKAPVITPAQFQTNLTTIISRASAALGYTPSIVLMPTWDGNAGATVSYPWQDYLDATYAVAEADPTHVCVFDLRKRVSTSSAPTAASTDGILHTDNKHPSPLGMRFIAESLAQFLTPQ